MTRAIDLNADLGEGMPWDAQILPLVSSANVSCGAHAGDPDAIAATLTEAGRLGVVVGAHPGWPDRANFGRVEVKPKGLDVAGIIRDQVESLIALAAGLGVAVRYLKPHGALYNQAMRDDDPGCLLAEALVEVAHTLNLPLLGLPGTYAERTATNSRVTYVREGFPDRGYRDDGSLIPRTEPGALIEGVDAVVAAAVKLVGTGRVRSLCLHGDSPLAVERAQAVRAAFERSGIIVRSPFGGRNGDG